MVVLFSFYEKFIAKTTNRSFSLQNAGSFQTDWSGLMCFSNQQSEKHTTHCGNPQKMADDIFFATYLRLLPFST